MINKYTFSSKLSKGLKIKFAKTLNPSLSKFFPVWIISYFRVYRVFVFFALVSAWSIRDQFFSKTTFWHEEYRNYDPINDFTSILDGSDPFWNQSLSFHNLANIPFGFITFILNTIIESNFYTFLLLQFIIILFMLLISYYFFKIFNSSELFSLLASLSFCSSLWFFSSRLYLSRMNNIILSMIFTLILYHFIKSRTLGAYRSRTLPLLTVALLFAFGSISNIPALIASSFFMLLMSLYFRYFYDLSFKIILSAGAVIFSIPFFYSLYRGLFVNEYENLSSIFNITQQYWSYISWTAPVSSTLLTLQGRGLWAEFELGGENWYWIFYFQHFSNELVELSRILVFAIGIFFILYYFLSQNFNKLEKKNDVYFLQILSIYSASLFFLLLASLGKHSNIWMKIRDDYMFLSIFREPWSKFTPYFVILILLGFGLILNFIKLIYKNIFSLILQYALYLLLIVSITPLFTVKFSPETSYPFSLTREFMDLEQDLFEVARNSSNNFCIDGTYTDNISRYLAKKSSSLLRPESADNVRFKITEGNSMYFQKELHHLDQLTFDCHEEFVTQFIFITPGFLIVDKFGIEQDLVNLNKLSESTWNSKCQLVYNNLYGSIFLC